MCKPFNPIVLLSKVRFFVELHTKNLQLQALQQALHAAELKASHQRTHLILDNAKDYAYIEMALDGTITEWGGGAERITGKPPSEVIGKHIALLYPEDDGETDRAAAELVLALKTGRAPIQRWLHRNDQTRFYADGSIVAIVDDDGKATGLAKIFCDATERMMGEIERERLFRDAQVSSDRLNSIFHQAPAFLCTLHGPDHIFEMANERYYQLIDKSPAILGKSVLEVLPEVASQGFVALLDKVFATGESYVGTGVPISVRQKDGRFATRILDFVYVALRDADGVITGVLAHGIDNTEREQFETAARFMDERYRKLIASMDEGFCLIDMIFGSDGQPCDYRFLEVNPIFSKQTGLPPSAIGKTALELVPDLDAVWVQRYGQVATSGVATRFIEEAQAMGRWFDVYATRLDGPGSTTVALLFSDITERRKADEELRRFAAELSEASRKKSEFLAVLAHELRNPLAPIRSGVEVIRMGVNKPDVVLRVVDTMDRQVSHMVHLIDDLLDVARITSGKIELKRKTMRLHDALQSAIEASTPLIAASGHTFKTAIAPEEMVLHADPIRIAQVIGNLLTNAVKYTPEGGVVTLEAQRLDDQVRITVTDNGVGIPSDALPSIFTMFSQVNRNLGRAQGGLGIGLSIVRQLVELHGGSVAVVSDGPGTGTSFQILLPLLLVSDKTVPLPLLAPEQKLERTFTVLVADDNVDAATTLANLLELQGHEVLVAYDGPAAVTMARQFCPDLIFLDIGMPGMSGHEVARAIRSSGLAQEASLIALTGWGSDDDRNQTRESGFDYHLTKPAQWAAIEKILQGAAMGRPVAQ
jgi:PAS domain S-box-containing protein